MMMNETSGKHWGLYPTPEIWFSSVSHPCAVHIWHSYKKHYQVFANTLWPSSGTLTYPSCFCSVKSNHEKKKKDPKLRLVLTPAPSSCHISTCCLMEACDIVLIFYSSLFNQGPNSPKFHGNPPHFVFTLHPTAQLLHQVIDTGVASSTPSCIMITLFFFVFLPFIYVTDRYLSIYFYTCLSPPANQKAASGAGRLSGEGGDPDVSAGCQREFVYIRGRWLNSRLICMLTCCQGAFMESVAYRSSGRKINLWDTH